jgi:hypothetical protein
MALPVAAQPRPLLCAYKHMALLVRATSPRVSRCAHALPHASSAWSPPCRHVQLQGVKLFRVDGRLFWRYFHGVYGPLVNIHAGFPGAPPATSAGAVVAAFAQSLCRMLSPAPAGRTCSASKSTTSGNAARPAARRRRMEPRLAVSGFSGEPLPLRRPSRAAARRSGC